MQKADNAEEGVIHLTDRSDDSGERVYGQFGENFFNRGNDLSSQGERHLHHTQLGDANQPNVAHSDTLDKAVVCLILLEPLNLSCILITLVATLPLIYLLANLSKLRMERSLRLNPYQ